MEGDWMNTMERANQICHPRAASEGLRRVSHDSQKVTSAACLRPAARCCVLQRLMELSIAESVGGEVKIQANVLFIRGGKKRLIPFTVCSSANVNVPKLPLLCTCDRLFSSSQLAVASSPCSPLPPKYDTLSHLSSLCLQVKLIRYSLLGA